MNSNAPLTVGVGDLCRFVARQGDLDLRFTPAPLAEEGRQLHEWVAGRRRQQYGEDFVAELALEQDCEGLRVRGRADGWLPGLAQVEEVKSFRGKLSKMPDNRRALHWAQVQVYGWILCEREQLDSIRLALVYVDADTQEEQLLVEYWQRDALRALCEGWCRDYARWCRQLAAHRLALLSAANALRFPYAAMHAGQRNLAENVYKAIALGEPLIAEAPTGTGKTLATLFPAFKALERAHKIFYLTAKTPGRALALAGVRQLNVSPLVCVELIAREKACEYPGRACNGEECPLARGFYDRLPAARAEAFAAGWLDADRLRAIALTHEVCPYYLSQEMCRWADVVVADYNYYFDMSGLLFALTREQQQEVVLLIDEAHNLPDRARAMYSASLTRADHRAVRKQLPAPLVQALKRTDRLWSALVKPLAMDERRLLDQVPARFIAGLQQFVQAVHQWQAEAGRSLPESVLPFYFSVLQFCKLAELPPEILARDYLIDLTKTGRGEAELNLRNLLPGHWLAPRFEAARTAVIFSATLSPLHSAQTLLGLPDNTALLQVASPFSSAQLEVQVHRQISTRYAHRARSLAPLVQVIGDQCTRIPGNYLAFFSSFDYLQQVAAALRNAFPDLALAEQTRRMAEAERRAFVARFSEGRPVLGLAVLGGAFGEGIDLPGEQLVGAFIATLGLPQFNPVNEDMRVRLQQQLGDGYAYTYLYPGLQKVVQAAGRVIRNTEDRGCIHLLDDRFAEAGVRALLPAWWPLH